MPRVSDHPQRRNRFGDSPRAVEAGSPPVGKKSQVELFNLADDLGETNDLAAKMPDKVKELSELLKEQQEKGRSR